MPERPQGKRQRARASDPTRSLLPKIRLRGSPANASEDVLRGKRAEAAAEQYFLNRGHTVVNCAANGLQHDLLVSEYGRVQVKSVCIKNKGRKHKGLVMSVFLGSSVVGYYSAEAFDWLCMVWLINSNSWVVLRPASELASTSDPRRMVSTVAIGVTKFRNIMQPVAPQQVGLFQ